jgi:EAL domain-containing protein (putative c-di-GMP-specific phosphodiesterase class I)
VAIGCDALQGYFTGPPQPAPLSHRYEIGESWFTSLGR